MVPVVDLIAKTAKKKVSVGTATQVRYWEVTWTAEHRERPSRAQQESKKRALLDVCIASLSTVETA